MDRTNSARRSKQKAKYSKIYEANEQYQSKRAEHHAPLSCHYQLSSHYQLSNEIFLFGLYFFAGGAVTGASEGC